MNWFERYGIVGMIFIMFFAIFYLLIIKPDFTAIGESTSNTLTEIAIKINDTTVPIKYVGAILAFLVLPCGYFISMASQLMYYYTDLGVQRIHKKLLQKNEKARQITGLTEKDSESKIEATLTYLMRGKFKNSEINMRLLIPFVTKRFDVISINNSIIISLVVSLFFVIILKFVNIYLVTLILMITAILFILRFMNSILGKQITKVQRLIFDNIESFKNLCNSTEEKCSKRSSRLQNNSNLSFPRLTNLMKNYKSIFCLILILLELLVLTYLGYLFWLNRFDKEIVKIFLNTICIASAYTFLRLLFSTSFPRISLVRVLLLGMSMLIIVSLAFALAFWVNMDNKKESDNFYIYFFYNRADKSMLCLDRLHSEWPFIVGTFNNLTQADKDIKIDKSFFQDYLDIAIIKTLSRRYRASWLIRHEVMPLTTMSRWGPKEMNLPVKSLEIRENEIPGYKENGLRDKFKIEGHDDIISVPIGTRLYIASDQRSKSVLREHNNLDKIRHIVMRNEYCTITLTFSCDDVLTGDFVADIQGPYDTKGLYDSKLEVFVFKAKYHILYNRLKMGSNKFLHYYKPWAYDVGTFFQDTFDVSKIVADKSEQYLIQIRGNTPERLFKN